MIRLEVREIKADGKAVWNQLEEDGQTAHPHDCSKKTTDAPTAATTGAGPTLDSADIRAILESLQLISRKLDAVLANSGTKTPK